MSFSSIVAGIKDLRIQGAQNVAKQSVKALLYTCQKGENLSKERFLASIFQSKKILFGTRPTEPLMRNCLNYLTANLAKEANPSLAITSRAGYLDERFERTEQKIAIYTSKKIMDKSVVFTHCHSSTVMRAMVLAKHMRREFQVYNTETRPRFQGRRTAAELAKAGIKVTLFVDSAARIALKKADVMLIGADAITSEGKVINKIGSELLAEVANKYEVPVYVCTDSWKFDPLTVQGYEEEIEEREGAEVWDKAPKGVRICNPAFEKISPDAITGIISELGIFRPEAFVQEVKEKYPFLF